MADEALINDLAGAAQAIGAFTHEDAFRSLIDAFRAGDRDSFRRLLEERKLVERCELVCEWIRSKECVLLCLELCGPPTDIELPDPREFAAALVRITQDEELVERLAATVEHRDGDGFRALLAELKLERFCHLICHWVCTVRTRLLCRVVCSPEPQRPVYLAEELTALGAVLGRLLENEKAFAQAVKAAESGNCELMRQILVRNDLDQNCTVICEWFCSWRCVRICFTLCRPFPIETTDNPLREAFDFAQAVSKLADNRSALGRLADAVASGDEAAYAGLVDELGLARFCTQLCHWICSFHCRLLCQCVCTPVLRPWFTHIGHFDIYADIDPGTGLTNKGLSYSGLSSNGGPGFGFFDCLELRGFCPVASPIDGTAMKYRFLIAGTNAPITGSRVCNADAGTRLISWPENLAGVAGAVNVPTFQSISIEGSPVPDPVPPAPGAPWQGPSRHVIVPDAQGWIVVDPDSISGGFTTLVGYDTGVDVPGGDPSGGIVAGDPIPAANQKDGADLGIIFEATRVVGSGPIADFSNSLAKVHINNWDAIRALTIQQFLVGPLLGCTPISTALDLNYTTDHELMADWSLSVTSFSSSAPGTVVSGSGPRGASAHQHIDTSTWNPCSYVVSLVTRTSRTTGLFDDVALTTQITFCIGVGG
ncbi:hypothetical protein [Specibacter cremeus]|uniref:hypothetical protein n=1 Tax=Specibacter cremeus TaxID=1629051 RepID=UPI000F7A0F28|nr:hypothetical protein [Specibacter cremeus]